MSSKRSDIYSSIPKEYFKKTKEIAQALKLLSEIDPTQGLDQFLMLVLCFRRVFQAIATY